METYKKQVLLKSWQNTTYQQAIWRARRRLAGKQEGDISNLESKILEENLLFETKPDYSRWIQNDLMAKRKTTSLASLSKPHLEADITINAGQSSEVTDNLHSHSAVAEYLSMVDPATLHNTFASNESTVGLSTSYENFGLCAGCFHKKGPHYHYHAPIRIGGGYSIYRRPNATVPPNYPSDMNWNTIKWLADLGKQTDSSSRKGYLGFGDDFSAKLFDQYIDRGGDPAALKEYLDSNFSDDVLEDLRRSGIDVELLQQYTKLYSDHIKSLLQENLQKQSKVVEKHVKTLDIVMMYASMESDGASMEMLIYILKKGRNCKELSKFENEGGNIEILEHFAQQIYDDPSRDVILSEFENFLRKNKQLFRAQLFMDYLNFGGDLDILKACLEENKLKDIYSSLTQAKLEALRKCICHFRTEEEFLKELKNFLQNHLHLFQGAELLQEFIENGGDLKILKEFVDADCNVYVVEQDEKDEESKFELLNRVGQKFLKNPVLKKVLDEFPEEPQLVDVYIQQGGNFHLLVQAISRVTEAKKLEEYVRHETSEVTKQFGQKQRNNNDTAISISFARSSNTFSETNTEGLPVLLLPRILDKAKANLVYAELVDSETSFNQNQGIYLSKSIDLQSLINSPATSSVNLSERQQVIQIYKSLASPRASSSSFSSVSGKRKKKLWVPPKPFEIEGSVRSLTYPKSPFSHRRVFDISSLSEDRIMNPAKQQRSHLDALKRNIRIEDFQKNWKLSITSPKGSVISAESRNEMDHSSILNEVIAQMSNRQQKETAPVDKKSRRQKQREKMKAAKKISREGKPTSAKKRTTASKFSHTLHLPPDQASKSHIFPDLVRKDENISSDQDKHRSTVELSNQAPPEEPGGLLQTTTEMSLHEESIRKLERKLSEKTSSYSSFLSANTMRKMRDSPETQVGRLNKHAKVLSKSESNLSDMDALLRAELRLSRAYLRQKQSIQKLENIPPETEDIHDYQPQEDFIDLLKKYCIIREDRLHVYKRVFDKYVLMKNIRDREKALEGRNNIRHNSDDEDFENNTLEGQFRKNENILRNVRESITEVQQQIAVAKDEVNKAVARIAYRKMGTMMSELHHKDDESSSGTNTSKPATIERKKELLKELTFDERRVCESDAEVRDRKVVLAQIRVKAKSLMYKEKNIHDTSKRLIKLIQKETLEKSFQKREKSEFPAKENRIFQNLHLSKDEVMDPHDFSKALSDIDKSLTFFDHSQLSEEISKSCGVRFQVFCVVAALSETKNIYRQGPCSLDKKINVCKEYYGALLGPDLEVLQIELKAAGITKKQRDKVVRELSRSNGARKLDFLDFVAYSPLFLTAHSKIIANPLAS